MSRETHVRFCERAVVKFHRATRLIVFGEMHLRRILRTYAAYFNVSRIHPSLNFTDLNSEPQPPRSKTARTTVQTNVSTSLPRGGGLPVTVRGLVAEVRSDIS
jgi:hypothetical protein